MLVSCPRTFPRSLCTTRATPPTAMPLPTSAGPPGLAQSPVLVSVINVVTVIQPPLFLGISSKQIAISEIGVTFPDETFGNTSRFGVPFTFLLRDILQFDEVRACNGSLCLRERGQVSTYVATAVLGGSQGSHYRRPPHLRPDLGCWRRQGTHLRNTVAVRCSLFNGAHHVGQRWIQRHSVLGFHRQLLQRQEQRAHCRLASFD